ncbi:hypothetical protein RJ55_02476 [Drechmeria coniospora]|nr:hypothetical protein RJ55_02476 [Drechmeria coniospora]
MLLGNVPFIITSFMEAIGIMLSCFSSCAPWLRRSLAIVHEPTATVPKVGGTAALSSLPDPVLSRIKRIKPLSSRLAENRPPDLDLSLASNMDAIQPWMHDAESEEQDESVDAHQAFDDSGDELMPMYRFSCPLVRIDVDPFAPRSNQSAPEHPFRLDGDADTATQEFMHWPADATDNSGNSSRHPSPHAHPKTRPFADGTEGQVHGGATQPYFWPWSRCLERLGGDEDEAWSIPTYHAASDLAGATEAESPCSCT